MTKRPKYTEACRWIAANDNPGDEPTADELTGYISVMLIADLWGKSAEQVAADVVIWRPSIFGSEVSNAQR